MLRTCSCQSNRRRSSFFTSHITANVPCHCLCCNASMPSSGRPSRLLGHTSNSRSHCLWRYGLRQKFVTHHCSLVWSGQAGPRLESVLGRAMIGRLFSFSVARRCQEMFHVFPSTNVCFTSENTRLSIIHCFVSFFRKDEHENLCLSLVTKVIRTSSRA